MTFEVLIRDAVREAVREVLREELKGRSSGGGAGELIRVSVAAERFGVSIATINTWCKKGLQVYAKNRVRLVDPAEVREYLKRVESGGPSPEERAAKVLASLKAVK